MVKYEHSRLDATFGALSDPTRRSILARLAEDALSVSALSNPYPMSMAAVSKHLRVLVDAGLVEQHRQGRERYCRLRPESLQAVHAWVERYRRFWESRLNALHEFLTDEDD